MAVDVCAEVSGSTVISPRISFSHDLNQADAVVVPVHFRSDASLLLDSSNSDFDFCVASNFSPQELSTADELFSHGKILPIELIKNLAITKQFHQSESEPNQSSASLNPPPPESLTTTTAAAENSKKKKLKELLSTSFDEDENEKPLSSSSLSSSSKSFWQFRRSTSLNCEHNRGPALFRSLQFLSRSNSTGSAPNPKQTTNNNSKDENQNRKLRKQSSLPPPSSSPSSISSSKSYHQKLPLKKNCRSYGDGGVRISPVLNFPPQYISKATQGLFGLGSLLCNGKDRKKKK